MGAIHPDIPEENDARLDGRVLFQIAGCGSNFPKPNPGFMHLINKGAAAAALLGCAGK
jgi:hypothetical protein